jgi:hypothetical protein
MGKLPLWCRIKGIFVGPAWHLFCWASGYPIDGYVCDFPNAVPERCESYCGKEFDDEG